jgi:hypothetical protein
LPVTLGFQIRFKVPLNLPFFQQSDIEFFHRKAKQKYRTKNRSDVAAGERISSSIFGKTSTWAKMLNLKEYGVEEDNRWQVSGYFKPYSWARLFRPENRQFKVFFTLGVSSQGKSLVCKIDCQRKAYNKETSLSNEQIAAFDRVIKGTGADWNEVSFEDIPYTTWTDLKELTEQFIRYYEPLYTEAVYAVKTSAQTTKKKVISNDFLVEVPVPETRITELPTKRYQFRGVVVDYDARNAVSVELGSRGEGLVIRLEKNNLKKQGRPDLAEKVEKVLDGEGYDIISYHPNETPKYIEVKTTSGTCLRPFFMSDSEWAFMKSKASKYYLYRVFDYDKNSDTGKYFCLKGDLEPQTLLRERQFEVFVKGS